jgi:hypothetical protein
VARGVQMTEPKGLTHNWNVAYRMFKADERYTAVFFVNNDVVFPNGSFARMAEARVSGVGGGWVGGGVIATGL